MDGTTRRLKKYFFLCTRIGAVGGLLILVGTTVLRLFPAAERFLTAYSPYFGIAMIPFTLSFGIAAVINRMLPPEHRERIEAGWVGFRFRITHPYLGFALISLCNVFLFAAPYAGNTNVTIILLILCALYLVLAAIAYAVYKRQRKRQKREKYHHRKP